MTEARFTLTIPALAHDAATELASALEENILLDPLAIKVLQGHFKAGDKVLVDAVADVLTFKTAASPAPAPQAG